MLKLSTGSIFGRINSFKQTTKENRCALRNLVNLLNSSYTGKPTEEIDGLVCSHCSLEASLRWSLNLGNVRLLHGNFTKCFAWLFPSVLHFLHKTSLWMFLAIASPLWIHQSRSSHVGIWQLHFCGPSVPSLCQHPWSQPHRQSFRTPRCWGTGSTTTGRSSSNRVLDRVGCRWWLEFVVALVSYHKLGPSQTLIFMNFRHLGHAVIHQGSQTSWPCPVFSNQSGATDLDVPHAAPDLWTLRLSEGPGAVRWFV